MLPRHRFLSAAAGITTTLAWTLLNSFIALIGYYFSAALVDNIYWGRVRIQLLGFTMVSILFFSSAIWYHTLTKSSFIGLFQFIYFFSSFWGQVYILSSSATCSFSAAYTSFVFPRQPAAQSHVSERNASMALHHPL